MAGTAHPPVSADAAARRGPLDHRRILDHPGPFHPFRGGDAWARSGGQATVDRFVDALYDGLGSDAGFGRLFARDLAGERARVKLFFAEWLGGERRYSGRAYASLAHRHEELPITPADAARWLGHARAALAVAVADAGLRREIIARLEPLARALVNGGAAVDHGGRVSGMCMARSHPALVATAHAQRGELARLRAVAGGHAPVVGRRTYAARMLHAAAVAGRVEVVRWLLDAGASPDTPCPLPVAVAGEALWGVLFVTPLCAARFKRRAKVAALLVERGAVDDVFTAAFLGDVAALARQLDAHPALADASDPAADALDITPLHHAAVGGHDAAVALILARGGGAPRGLDQAVRSAAERGHAAIVERLLAHGADARGIGPGRWVLDPRIAPLLARAGASVGDSGAWIRLSCTGNQGRRDDPEYVRALLAHGARVDDRQGEDATALHYAAKAGFVGTIAVLLEHGADPGARDAKGRLPVDWLASAAKSVDRERVREALARRR